MPRAGQMMTEAAKPRKTNSGAALRYHAAFFCRCILKMPLHPEYEAMLRQVAAANAPRLVDLPVAAGREMFRAMQPQAPDVAVGGVVDADADGVPVRVYRPSGEPLARKSPFPVVMMFHGGGWVLGDLHTADSQSREVCNGAGVVVVSVDYRLAPEHRCPAAAEDCYQATVWAARHAAEFDGDASRLAVVGDSAGGNLAAVVAQLARERGGPRIVFQLLVYPVTDGRMATASFRENAEGYLLTAESMRWFWNHYAPSEAERLDPRASPLLAADLSNLPPALVLTAQYDPLRDEGEAYADALIAAGTPAEKVCYEGLIHGFFGQTRSIAAARPPMARACAALREALFTDATEAKGASA